MNTHALYARGIASRMRMGMLCLNPSLFLIVFAFSGIGTIFPQSLHAQQGSVHWTAKEGYKVGFQLSTSSDTILAFTQFHVDLHLETLGDTVAMGASYVFGLPDQVSPDASGEYSLPAPNPLGAEQDLEVSNDWDAQARESSSAVWRTDGVAQTVSGKVLRLNFETGSVPVATANLVQDFDGGIVMEENADLFLLKRDEWEAMDDTPDVTVRTYPNPCRDWLAIEPSAGQTCRYTLRDLAGREWKSGAAIPGTRIELEGIPAGILMVEIRDGQGRIVRVEKVIKQ